MPRKKSIKKAAQAFREKALETQTFVDASTRRMPAGYISRIHEAAIITLYRDFEELILEVLVGAINNDTKTISAMLSVDFPKHLSDEVCRYIITGPSYFDFKGRSGLIKRVKQYVPDDHYFVEILRAKKYKACIDQLCTLRNFAAHASPQSKRAVLDVVGQSRIGSAGSWLKSGDRFEKIVAKVCQLADETEAAARY